MDGSYPLTKLSTTQEVLHTFTYAYLFTYINIYSLAGINWDERLLIELKDRLRNIPIERVMAMRAQCAFLYTNYFRNGFMH